MQRWITAAGLTLTMALAACGGGDGGELAAGNSSLSAAEIDAALGPADQTNVQDALAAENLDGLENEADAAAAEADDPAANGEDEQ